MTPYTFDIVPHGPQYAEALYEAVVESLVELGAWMPWAHSHYLRDEAIAWVNRQPEEWAAANAYEFAIIERTSGAFVGGVGLNNFRGDKSYCNLGYWVRTSWTRRGAASTAARLAAHYGFSELGLQRCEIVAAVGNLASQRTALKTGAVREGVLRRRLQVGGQWVDAVIFSLIPSDLGF